VKDGVLEAGAYRTTPSKQRAFRTAGGEVVPPQVASFWAQVYGSRQLSSSPLEPASSVGSLQVRRYDVDHSVFGACAFAIQTTAGWVVYTGDLRCHGGNAEMTHRFALAARELKPILLVCEGTHVENSACVPESAVYDAALSCVRSSAGRLAVADFGARNIERLLTFLRIAEETDRRLAVTARDAFVLDAMRKVSDTVPDLRSERHIAIVSEPKASLGKWESEFVRPAYADQLVTLGDIRAAQGDFILCYSFFDVNDLVDVSPDAGGAWLYSASEAYNEEQVIDMQRLTNWVGHFKMDLYSGDTEYGPLHTSGHLSGPELLDLIRTINPRAVIPVHTERPEFFVDNLGHEMQVLPPQRGVTAHLG
jgi:ribonuclease J